MTTLSEIPAAETLPTETPILAGRFPEELAQIFKSFGEPAYRGQQAFRRINRHLTNRLEEFTEFPKALREKLESAHVLPELHHTASSREESGTEKHVFETGIDKRDGAGKKVEAVWIVSGKRRTACISSQIGCTLNCSFCATGTLKFRGNLKAWEIVEQAYALMRGKSERLTNIVFMGMGEPFYNYEEVIRAAKILNHPEGLGLSARHITISTAGVVPGIARFTEERQPFNLAISLNHPDPEGRRQIMDVAERFDLEELLDSIRRYAREMRRRVTFEYIMIPDVNMGEENARKLIRIARSLRSKINLIPLNTTLQGWRRPTEEEGLEFQRMLIEGGVPAFNRGSPGRTINGACGMLALQS